MLTIPNFFGLINPFKPIAGRWIGIVWYVLVHSSERTYIEDNVTLSVTRDWLLLDSNLWVRQFYSSLYSYLWSTNLSVVITLIELRRMTVLLRTGWNANIHFSPFARPKLPGQWSGPVDLWLWRTRHGLPELAEYSAYKYRCGGDYMGMDRSRDEVITTYVGVWWGVDFYTRAHFSGGWNRSGRLCMHKQSMRLEQFV